MNHNFKKISPYLILFLGVLLLFFLGKAVPAGVCFMLGIVMIIERIWPEKWNSEEQ